MDSQDTCKTHWVHHPWRREIRASTFQEMRHLWVNKNQGVSGPFVMVGGAASWGLVGAQHSLDPADMGTWGLLHLEQTKPRPDWRKVCIQA